MNELPLVNELVGGPFDGRTWSSHWVPHWCQSLSWTEFKPRGRSRRWVDYELKEGHLAYKDGQPCVYFRYHFVGFRESFPSWFSWLTTKLGRWGRRQYLRLVRSMRGPNGPSVSAALNSKA
jgi:hypothetical protein